MAEKRRQDRDIVIEHVKNPARRLAASADAFTFLSTYLPEKFFYDWTPDQRLMIDQIRYRSQWGGDKAIAAPRGCGKTTIAECELGIDAILHGVLRYPVIISASGPMSTNILDNIKAEYETNDLLHADFPEVCGPILALGRANQKAAQQTYRGRFTLMEWSKGAIRFPTVWLVWCPRCYYPDPIEKAGGLECPNCDHRYQEWKSVSSGSLIDSCGIDGSIRGLRKGSLRPDFVLIDDPETEESARSDLQVNNREKTIEHAIGGLGSVKKPVSRLMLVTIQNTQCLSAKYTDRSQKPSWDGDRLPLVKRWPKNKELWEQYIDLRKSGMTDDPPDKLGRNAHQFYIDNKADMDDGVIVSDETRFTSGILEDGIEAELSTIQRVHNEASDKGWDYVFNELQNDPQEEDSSAIDQLCVPIIVGSHNKYRGRLSGIEAGTVPNDCSLVTMFIDVQHDRLYFETVAWHPNGSRYVVDYDTHGADIGREMTLSDATMARLLDLKTNIDTNPLADESGNERDIDCILVDSGDGNVSGVVYAACQYTGFIPSKGKSGFNKPNKDRSNSGVDPWHVSKIIHQRKNVEVLIFDVEKFRRDSRESWLVHPSQVDGRGVFLFGDDSKQHGVFGKHLSVIYDPTLPVTKRWIEPRNHDYWDCDYGNFVARSVAIQKRAKALRTGKRLTDIAREKRGKITRR